MRPTHPIAFAAFAGLMMAAASTANDRVEQPAATVPAAATQTAAPMTVRIPDPVPLPSTRPVSKIVVDLK